MQLNNPFGDNYPFIGPPMDDPSTPKVVYDAYITYYVPTLEYKLPLKLAYIRPNIDAPIKITDSDNKVIFNDTVYTSIWGDDYTIYKGYSDGVSVSIIAKRDVEYTPDHGDLCLRCVYTQPKHVTNIIVNDIELSPNISIDAGYNIAYDIDKDTYNEIRPQNLVTINAIPGEGIGQVPSDCSQPVLQAIRSINGIYPDDSGTIYIESRKATKVSQIGSGRMQLGDDTTPCCLCADFSYLGNLLQRHIKVRYEIGATAEAARDSLKDLMELLSCGNLNIILCKEFCPIRMYIDTTWERYPIVTAEIRNVLPAVIKNLQVHVDVSTEVQDATPLRSFVPASVACNNPTTDAQAGDHNSIISFNGNSWDINWSADDLGPGFTLWASVRFRNGSACFKGSESVTATATATFDVEPFGCVKEECLHNLNIRKVDTKTATIKGGYGWNDPSGKPQDTPTHGSDGALGCMVKRVYEICKEEHPDRS